MTYHLSIARKPHSWIQPQDRQIPLFPSELSHPVFLEQCIGSEKIQSDLNSSTLKMRASELTKTLEEESFHPEFIGVDSDLFMDHLANHDVESEALAKLSIYLTATLEGQKVLKSNATQTKSDKKTKKYGRFSSAGSSKSITQESNPVESILKQTDQQNLQKDSMEALINGSELESVWIYQQQIHEQEQPVLQGRSAAVETGLFSGIKRFIVTKAFKLMENHLQERKERALRREKVEKVKPRSESLAASIEQYRAHKNRHTPRSPSSGLKAMTHQVSQERKQEVLMNKSELDALYTLMIGSHLSHVSEDQGAARLEPNRRAATESLKWPSNSCSKEKGSMVKSDLMDLRECERMKEKEKRCQMEHMERSSESSISVDIKTQREYEKEKSGSSHLESPRESQALFFEWEEEEREWADGRPAVMD